MRGDGSSAPPARPAAPFGSAAWVRSLRAPRPSPDPWRPLGWTWEEERAPATGEQQPALTVFLAGAECPFTCVYCDLWKQTLLAPTPAAAIPAQLQDALQAAAPIPDGAAIKLYNASNFFDARSVPPGDDAAIAAQLAPFARVTVECHPRLVGERCRSFAARLPGRLEVAMGLETVHPEAFRRIGKGMTLADFDRAAATLADADVSLRVFVLLAPPFVPPAEAVSWAVRSVAYALDRGAERVCIIPARGGNGAMEVLRERGDFVPPNLDQLEAALEEGLRCARALGRGAVVTADLWDAADLFAGSPCAAARLRRLHRMNRDGQVEPPHSCPACSGQRSAAAR